MTRNDPHRVGAIIPTEYAFVLSFGVFPAEGSSRLPIRFNVDRALALWEAGPSFRLSHRNDGLFTCTVCGASYNHGDLWRHLPTGDLITVGHECADKYGMFADRSEWVAWHKEQTRLRSLAAKDRKFKMKAREFMATVPGLAETLAMADTDWAPPLHERIEAHQGPIWSVDDACPLCVGIPYRPLTREQQKQRWRIETLCDMRGKLNRFGSLSEKQIAFATKLAAEIREAQNAPVVEERHVPAPEGKVRVSGKIVSAKQHETAFGNCWKMTVKVETPEGSWLVWSTVPASLVDRYMELMNAGTVPGGDLIGWLKGKMVEFNATLQRSDRDAHFAFAKRPTGASLVA